MAFLCFHKLFFFFLPNGGQVVYYKWGIESMSGDCKWNSPSCMGMKVLFSAISKGKYACL